MINLPIIGSINFFKAEENAPPGIVNSLFSATVNFFTGSTQATPPPELSSAMRLHRELEIRENLSLEEFLKTHETRKQLITDIWRATKDYTVPELLDPNTWYQLRFIPVPVKCAQLLYTVMHPLQFLLILFCDPELRQGVKEIFADEVKWGLLIGGDTIELCGHKIQISQKVETALTMKMGEFCTKLPRFLEELSIHDNELEEELSSAIREKDWKHFLTRLIEHLPM